MILTRSLSIGYNLLFFTCVNLFICPFFVFNPCQSQKLKTKTVYTMLKNIYQGYVTYIILVITP